MESKPYLSAGTIDRIKTVIRRRGFETRRHLQDPMRTIVLDRGGVALTPQDVLIVWANREPSSAEGDASSMQNVDGQLQAWQTLDAKPGDRFMLDGRLATVTEPSRVIDGVAIAGFRWATGV